MGGRGASSGIAVRSNITGAGVESDSFFGKIKKSVTNISNLTNTKIMIMLLSLQIT